MSECVGLFGHQVELAQHRMAEAPTTRVQAVVEKTHEEITSEFVSEVSEISEEQHVQVFTRTSIDRRADQFRFVSQTSPWQR